MNAPRGQNMLLLSMGLFLITLMVTTTLGIASRVKDNHELQTLADAAAYSSAVVNARAYNNSALLNRVEVAQWVTMAADQSLIDWTSYTRGALNSTRVAAIWLGAVNSSGGGAKNSTDNSCDVTTTAQAVYDQSTALAAGGWIVDADWDQMDQTAGKEARSVQGSIGTLRDEIRVDMTTRLFNERGNQTMAKAMVARSQMAGVSVIEGPPGMSATQGPNGVSRREAGCPWDGVSGRDTGGGTGLCVHSAWGDRMRDAALGSRKDPFLRFRGEIPKNLQNQLDIIKAANPNVVTLQLTAPIGEGYWSTVLEGPNDREISFADDHQTNAVTLTIGGGTKSVVVSAGPPIVYGTQGCTATNNAVIGFSKLTSTHIDDDLDEHVAGPFVSGDNVPPKDRHTMGSCQPDCPSVWVRTSNFTYGPTNDANGQPKVVVALERDYAKVDRPWDLNFAFKFSSSGPGSRYDNRGEKVVSQGLDISKASAFATGMTYYHRRQDKLSDRWQEFPNLLNPFWRATLVPADVDRDTGAVATAASSDVQDINLSYFQGTHTWQADAYKELVTNGAFKGLH